MYHDSMIRFKAYSESTVKYNAAHEIGHTLKLDEASHSASSVMQQKGLAPFPGINNVYNQDIYELRVKWGN